MPEETSASSSSASADPRVTELTNDVTLIKTQLADILEALKSNQPAAPPSHPPSAATPDAADIPSSSAEVYKVGTLQFSLPPPSTTAVAEVLTTRHAYGETGKLNLFIKPPTLPPYPSSRFIPTPDGLFGRIKTSDNRDSWEAEILWNIGHNQECALAASHKVAEALAAGDIAAATDAFAVVHHYTNASYSRVQERVDFFADALESGKSEAILLQKYLREDDQPYTSALYRNTKSEFAKLRAQAYAKEFNKQAASQVGRKGNNTNNTNNYNNNNRNHGGKGPGGNANAPKKD